MATKGSNRSVTVPEELVHRAAYLLQEYANQTKEEEKEQEILEVFDTLLSY